MQQAIKILKSRYRDDVPPVLSSGLYHPQALIYDLQKSFPRNTIWFIDMGNAMAWATRYMQVEPGQYYMAMGFASMGYAPAAVIGGKVALPDHPVVALCGDGSFQMVEAEVGTAVKYGIPAIWIILNNSKLGTVYHGRKLFATPVPEGISSDLLPLDFAEFAKHKKAIGIRIEEPGGLTPDLIQEVLESKQPTVIDVLVDSEVVPPILSRIKTIDNLSRL